MSSCPGRSYSPQQLVASFRQGSNSLGDQKKMMRRGVLPQYALLLVVCAAASLAEVAEARRGGRGGRVVGGGGGGGRNGGSRGLSGGTWTACVGSSLLTAAVMLL